MYQHLEEVAAAWAKNEEALSIEAVCIHFSIVGIVGATNILQFEMSHNSGWDIYFLCSRCTM